MTASSSVSLHLPGGGLSGALYQVGALAALEDALAALGLARPTMVVGSGSGATVAAMLAGGVAVDRMYRALLDPSDAFFPLERGHIARIDLDEWRRTLETGWVAIRHVLARFPRFTAGEPGPSPALRLLEQLDRLNDSLPAGLFTLDRYERFLAELFLRRGIPNDFTSMPTALRVAAYDVDSGARALFGSPGLDDTPVSLACAASLALPLFFSPVRVGARHYLEGGLGRVAHLDVAEDAAVRLAVVVNPLVPVSVERRGVPTGHGVRESVRDKGLLWLYNQASRIGAHERLGRDIERVNRGGKTRVLLIEPRPSDAQLFLHNPSANLDVRRAILEYAFRTTRERMERWVEEHREALAEAGVV